MKLKIPTELSSSGKTKHTMPQSQAVLFSWELKSIIPNQAEVLAYRAADIFDDRFHSIERGQSVENMLVIKLGLAQQWTYYCTEGGGTSAACCKSASMMRRILLKQGTYLYMYRINGELKLNVHDKVTRLATKREVNYIDVRQSDEELSYQDAVDTNSSRACSTSKDQINNFNNKTEFLKAFAAVKDMYHVNMTMNRVSPLEREVWERVEKEMAARVNLNGE